MKKKIGLSFAVICTLNLLATSALADAVAAPTCGYDVTRAKELKLKGDKRAARAKEIIKEMVARYAEGEKNQDALEKQDAQDKADGKSDSKVAAFEGSSKNYDKMMPEILPAVFKDPGKCLVVVPSEKTVDILIPFFTGLNYGRGVEFCKDDKGHLDLNHPTSYVQIEGLDAGFGFGVEATDLVLTVSKDNVNNRKLMLSGDITGAAGTVGRDISVGIDSDGKSFKPGVAVSYSSSKGLLAAATLDYATVAPDKTMIAAEAGKPLPKENFLMRLFHSSKRKHEDAACAQKDVASTEASHVSDVEQSTVASVLPEESAPQVAQVAVANASIVDDKGLSPEAQAAADSQDTFEAQAKANKAGSTLDTSAKDELGVEY